jgi:excisionase family DNA binding protein
VTKNNTRSIFRCEDDENQSANPLAVSIETACKLVGVGRTTMWVLIKSGRVKTLSIGRRRLVVYSSLEQLVSGVVGS